MEWLSNKIVSVIIIAAGAKDYLWSLLDSIKKQTYTYLEVIVIDNSLNPNLSQKISKYYPEIKLYPNPKNLFYCEALNKGIELSRGDFMLCLNDDVILDQKFIEEGLKKFDIDERIGMVSGKILRSDGRTIDSTGLFLTCWRSAKERGYGRPDKGQYEKEGYIFGVNGAVAFYHRKMLEDIKIGPDYFDSDYRFFYEDLDTAWRARNYGWKAYYTPLAVAYHVRGATARQARGIGRSYARMYLDKSLLFDLVKNRYLTIIKNESLFGFILHLPFILFYDFFAWGHILFFKPSLIKKFIFNLEIFRFAFKKRRLLKKRWIPVGESEFSNLDKK